ncbi:MAG: hypothetical protein A2Z47_12035 [Thermodesulfovibrio sp. RBG_19FT_COMBO_42_12]|nr:MAG: hypothetical protein A2Z47_12035 [Thermodesulfovibrio sp. RBG_19FT_COMBO_42_12]
MKKKLLAVTLCLFLAVSVSACKKKEAQPPVPQAPGTMAPGQMPQGPVMQGPLSPGGQQQVPGSGMTMPKGQSQIMIPDSVRGKWSAARIIFEDRITKTKKEYTVKLNSDFSIPSSNLRITVGEFLPNFKMEGLTITSMSNQSNNPALAIRVFEGSKQIFPAPGRRWGWLFAKVPTIHPFEHPKYGIILKEGMRRG